ncbi:MAG: hypothetical protein AB7O67_23640 [Vicinamibacterales bacterium]
MERDGNSVARRCLNEAIDAGPPRKVLAAEHEMSEPQFSKVTSGAAAYDIAFLDRLSDPLLEDFLKRYGRERGFTVRWTSIEELEDQIVACLKPLVAALRLRDVKTRPAKADLPVEAARRHA